MGRLDRIEDKLKLMESSQTPVKKKKGFKLPWKITTLMKKSSKKDDFVVIQYLTQKYEIRFKLCKIISGDVVVVNNKVHRLNPKKMWKYGKYRWYIHKEIDREPISNEDLEEVKARNDDTEADVPLIKAVLGAIQRQQQSGKKNVALIIGVLIAAGIGAFILFGGG